MQNKELTIKVDDLRTMLENKEPVIVLDVRPKEQREEWQIPRSIHVDAYNRLRANDPTALNEIAIPKNFKVVTVCAAGRTSKIAANQLRRKGIDAYSLEGGMKAWSIAWNLAEIKLEEDIELIQVRRTGKGCLSYIISSRGLALIIDPSLEVKRYEKILKDKELQIRYVFETHIHADHLSRAKLLAEKFNAQLFLPDKSKVQFPFTPLKNGEQIRLEEIRLDVLYTPGHTFESSCFLVNGKALITGDTLFINGVGRPDLESNTDSVKEKAKLLYHSLLRLLALNEDIIVLPAHTSKPIEFDNQIIETSIGKIKTSVDMLRLSEDDFVNNLLQRIPPVPPNYLSIVEKNVKGDFSDINPVDLEAGPNHCAIS